MIAWEKVAQFDGVKAGDRPVLVWFRGPGERDGRGRDLYPCLRQRSVVLALRRFQCVRVDVGDLTDAEWESACSDRIGFRWFDPAGREVGAPLTGRRAGSVTTFSRRLAHVWRRSFETALRPWVAGMRKIVKRAERNRKARVLTEWQLLRETSSRRPHRPRVVRLTTQLADLCAGHGEILADEVAWKASCRLRVEFRPPETKERPKPKLR